MRLGGEREESCRGSRAGWCRGASGVWGARAGAEQRRRGKREKEGGGREKERKKKMEKENGKRKKKRKGGERERKRRVRWRDSCRDRGARSATRGIGHACAVGRVARVESEQGGGFRCRGRVFPKIGRSGGNKISEFRV